MAGTPRLPSRTSARYSLCRIRISSLNNYVKLFYAYRTSDFLCTRPPTENLFLELCLLGVRKQVINQVIKANICKGAFQHISTEHASQLFIVQINLQLHTNRTVELLYR